MLPGKRWYRFVHPGWGDFTVAVCSDLLDPSPWASLRGEMLHLFTCAYNQDVELYEAMTWVRAYENYVNVVLTNHGEYGGSFAWSPRHGKDKAIIRLHGSKLNLVADVRLPVRDLFQAQQHRLQESIEEATREWLGPRMARAETRKIENR